MSTGVAAGGGDAATIDAEREGDQVAGLADQGRGDGQVFEPARPVGKRSEIPHASRLTALSCHFRRARWLMSDSTAKIRTPSMEISSRAANMRG